MKPAVVVSLQVGLPVRRGTEGSRDPRRDALRDVFASVVESSPGGNDALSNLSHRGTAWTTGIYKDPVEGPVVLGFDHFAGDGQADLQSHGGPDKAVLAYSADHYPRWREELAHEMTLAREMTPGLEMTPGAFGENLTIAGQDERTVCIGDSYEIGEARLQVSQPRLPCWKLARRWDLPDLPARVVKSARGGWYLRVLREGPVTRGNVVTLLERPYPQWTVARVHDAYIHGADPETAAALASCALLAEGWRESFRPGKT